MQLQRPAFVASLVLAVVALSGCRSRNELRVDIRADGSGELSFAYGLDRTAVDSSRAQNLDPKPFPPDAGITETPWREGDFTGRRYSIRFGNLRELRALLDDAFGGSGRVDRHGSRFAFRLRPGTTLGPIVDEVLANARRVASPDAIDDLDPDHLAEIADVRFVLRLPGRLTSHDADEVHDGVLVWHLLPSTDRVLTAASRLDGHPSTPSRSFARAGVATVFGVLGVLGVFAFVASRRRSKASRRHPSRGPAPGGNPR